VGKVSRPLGPVWIVVRNNKGKKQKGFFKFPTRKNKARIGPLLANELISYRLAKALKLKVAKVQLTKIKGKRGVVSTVRPAPYHYTWSQLAKKLSYPVIYYIDNPNQLLKTFVFDIWICNLDRHADNLITYPLGNKYSFYLIDHGLALLGAIKWRKVPWNSPYWDHVARYNKHYVQGLISYINDYNQLSKFVKEIQRIPSYKIRKIVKSTPASILSPGKKEIIIKLLLYRQRHLDHIVRLWVKEY
jgi:hypothetical protein